MSDSLFWNPIENPRLPLLIPSPEVFEVAWDGYGLAQVDPDIHGRWDRWDHVCGSCQRLAADLGVMAACPHHSFKVLLGNGSDDFIRWLGMPPPMSPMPAGMDRYLRPADGQHEASKCARFAKRDGRLPEGGFVPMWPFSNVSFVRGMLRAGSVTP